MEPPDPGLTASDGSLDRDDSVDSTHASDSRRSPEATNIPAGTRIGRYVVISRVGAGAMGVVVAAYDPKLDRKVALKLRRPRGAESDRARARLTQEAQALARLNHPNVVSVHDVGTHDGQVFVAMEFVRGQTLRDWAQARNRDWREVVSVFADAGAGLAAAHDNGLVHRDFKPDNVMIGADGRVRVMDFGLASTAGPGIPDDIPTALIERERAEGSIQTRLTRTGKVMGTPRYMAPEQFVGKTVTAQSDQFGFCVALFELLYRIPPFEGESLVDIAHAARTGEIRARPSASNVPPWLDRLVRRGLSPKADDRFASMATLLDALATGEVRRRRRNRVTGAGVLAVAVLGVLGVQRYDRERRIERCHAEGNAIDALWNPEAKEAIRSGFEQTGVSYAVGMADRVTPWIDEHAEAWRSHADAACMSATVHETWDEPMFDKARWCLEQSRLQLSTLVTELAQIDARTVPRAVELATRMFPVDHCTDEDMLEASLPPPSPSRRVEASDIRAQLARARFLEAAGHYEPGLELASSARARAEELGRVSLQATAQLVEAILLGRTGKKDEAVTAGIAAYMNAVESDSWSTAVDAATWLVHLIGRVQARPDDAEVWAEHARVAISHNGDPKGLLEASRLHNLGSLSMAREDNEQALALYEQALAIKEDVLGPDHPDVAKTINNIGVVHQIEDELDEAMERFSQVLSIRKKLLHPDHPDIAKSMVNIAIIHYGFDRYEQAESLYLEATTRFGRSLGPEHPHVAVTSSNLAKLYLDWGHPDRARDTAQQALEVAEKSLGPGHPLVGNILNTLGDAQTALGAYGPAQTSHERALVLREKALGPDHTDIAFSLLGVSALLTRKGEYDRARTGLERALTIWTAALGEDDPTVTKPLIVLARIDLERGEYEQARAKYERSRDIREQADPDDVKLGDTLVGLGTTLVELGQAPAALEPLERALELRSSAKAVPPWSLASARFALARALWATPAAEGGDRQRALRLAEQALDGMAAEGGFPINSRDTVEAWLAEHGEGAPL